MPTYDYLCPNGHRFEVIHGVTADGPTVCPICGEGPVRKAFSAPSIVFRGSGWAKKDRSTTSRPPKAPSTTADGGSSGAGAGAGSADAPASKSKDGSDAGSSTSSSKSTGSTGDAAASGTAAD
jgi:putative FmdB family regulatory protein